MFNNKFLNFFIRIKLTIIKLLEYLHRRRKKKYKIMYFYNVKKNKKIKILIKLLLKAIIKNLINFKYKVTEIN